MNTVGTKEIPDGGEFFNVLTHILDTDWWKCARCSCMDTSER